MNIFTIITTLYLAKDDQHQRIKAIRIIKSEETSTHCFRLLKFLITAENRPDISPQTMMFARKCSKIQAVKATIHKIIMNHQNRYSLWW